jgi:hypothetical protein
MMMMALASVAVDHELLTRERDHQPLRRSSSRESVRLIQCREYNRKVVDRTIEGVPPATFSSMEFGEFTDDFQLVPDDKRLLFFILWHR